VKESAAASNLGPIDVYVDAFDGAQDEGEYSIHFLILSSGRNVSFCRCRRMRKRSNAEFPHMLEGRNPALTLGSTEKTHGAADAALARFPPSRE
jgi:hypothetical protein